MPRRIRKREPAYTHNGWALKWHGKEAIAERRENGDRERIKLGLTSPGRKPSPALEQRARDALDKFAEARKAVLKHAEAPSIGMLWDMWTKDRAADGFSNELQGHQWKVLGPAFANSDPLLLTQQDCRDYAQTRFDLGRGQWTVHNELRSLRAMMKWAFENNKIPRRPKVWVPRPGENRDRVLTYEEARTLVAAAGYGDPHIYLFVRIAFATAARHMAILDLEWPRVDFDANTIEFDLDLPPDPMSKAWRKGRAKVFMGAALRAALELAKKGRRCDHVIEHGGKRLVTVRSGFFNAVKRAGLAWQAPDPKNPENMVWTTDVTPHTIRHTVLTWLEQGKVDPRRAQQLAGHKDLETTTSIYQHPDAAMLKEAVELLEERLLAPPTVTSDPARNEEDQGRSPMVASAPDGDTRASSSEAS